MVKDLILCDLKNTYSDVKKGEFIALFGSSGFLEISINQGSAAKKLNCKIKKDLIKIKLA